jgi:hypothetical protein
MSYGDILDSIDLWVWDFDDTLIDTKAYYTRNRNHMKRQVILNRCDKELDSEIPNRLFFVDLVKTLVDKKDKKVVIASWGTYYIIQAYMDRIFGEKQKYFTKQNILTINRDKYNNVIPPYPKDKNYMLKPLMEKYNIQDPSKVVFFDDSKLNIDASKILGIYSIHIPGKHSQERKKGNKCSLFCKKHLRKLQNIVKKQNIEQIKKFKHQQHKQQQQQQHKHKLNKLSGLSSDKIEGFSVKLNNNYFLILAIIILVLLYFIKNRN